MFTIKETPFGQIRRPKAVCIFGLKVAVSQRGNIQFLSVGADSISARGVSGAYGMLPYGVG